VLISVEELINLWNLKPTGVVHVGAHLAEEAEAYERFGWTPVIWVEAQPQLVTKLKLNLDPGIHSVLEAAVWNVDGAELELNLASNSQSSSLLKFGLHEEYYPEITYVGRLKVRTSRLDTLLQNFDCPNFINLDLQGVELEALQGLGNLIERFDYIFVEINRKEVYKNCTSVHDLDQFLSDRNFSRVGTRWKYREGWGDALYVKRHLKPVGFTRSIKRRLKNIYFYRNQVKTFLRPN